MVVVTISRQNNCQPFVHVSVCRDGEIPDAKLLKNAVKTSKALRVCTVQRFHASYGICCGMTKRKTMENLREGLEALTAYLRQNGLSDCCQDCGAVQDADACCVAGAVSLLCPSCFASRSGALDLEQQEKDRKSENMIGGFVGAFLGSLLGAAAIVIFGQLGYVAALSGVVAAVCTMKGYELLGGRLTKKGIVISIAMILVMAYIGNRMDWAISVAQYFEVDIFSAFRAIPDLVAEEYLDSGMYYGNLAPVYIFALLGAVPTIGGAARSQRQRRVTCKMSDTVEL